MSGGIRRGTGKVEAQQASRFEVTEWLLRRSLYLTIHAGGEKLIVHLQG